MKKILLYLFAILLSFVAKAQYPVQQNLGSATTLVNTPYPGAYRGNHILQVYADTTTANTTNIKFYNGATILVSGDTSLYVRYNGQWRKQLNGTSIINILDSSTITFVINSGIDSMKFDGYCFYTYIGDSIKTYCLNNFFDSVTLNHDSSQYIYYNAGVPRDSVATLAIDIRNFIDTTTITFINNSGVDSMKFDGYCFYVYIGDSVKTYCMNNYFDHVYLNSDSSQYVFSNVGVDRDSVATLAHTIGLIVNTPVTYYVLTQDGMAADSVPIFGSSGNANSLISIGGAITVVDSTVTIPADIVYQCAGVVNTYTSDYTTIIHSIPDGYYQNIAVFVGCNDNIIDTLQGVVNANLGITPIIPENSVLITIITVYGSAITPPVPIIPNTFWSKGGDLITTQNPFFGTNNNRSPLLGANNQVFVILDSSGVTKFQRNLILDTVFNNINESESRSIIFKAKGVGGINQTGLIGYDGFGGINGGALKFYNQNGYMSFQASLPFYNFTGDANIFGESGLTINTYNTTKGIYLGNAAVQASGALLRVSNRNIYNTDKPKMWVNFDGSTAITTDSTGAPDASSVLDLKSTTKGMLAPRMTGTQMNAISSPADGLMVYNITDTAYYWYKFNTWTKFGTGTGGGGGGGINIYNSDSSLLDNRTVILNDKNLSFNNSSNSFSFNLYPIGDRGMFFSNGDNVTLNAGNDANGIVADVNNGNSRIWLKKNDSSIRYTAGTYHKFSGTIYASTVADGLSTDSALTILNGEIRKIPATTIQNAFDNSVAHSDNPILALNGNQFGIHLNSDGEFRLYADDFGPQTIFSALNGQINLNYYGNLNQNVAFDLYNSQLDMAISSSQLGGNYQINSQFKGDTSNGFQFIEGGIVKKGIRYNTYDSTQWDYRTLVTKGYVDNHAGGGALTNSNFVDNETPSGTINGSNVTFTLANAAVTGSVHLYQNGVRIFPPAFSVSGATITMGVAPLTGSTLGADYRK